MPNWLLKAVKQVFLTSHHFLRLLRAVVVAQLVEWSLLIPDVRGLNPVIGNYLYIEHLFTVNCIEKTKIKKKEARNGPFLKDYFFFTHKEPSWTFKR